MNERIVESMVTHLADCACNCVDIGCPKCKKNARNGLALKQLIDEVKHKTSMKWNFFVKDFLPRCPQFCMEKLVDISRPLVTARETNDRKVLAPLALKLNTDNIIAGTLDNMSRKRKCDSSNFCTPYKNKRFKIDDSIKSCSVVVKRDSLKILLLQYKCVNRVSYVKLYDVLKEIPLIKQKEKAIAKSDYMNILELHSNEQSESKRSSRIKSANLIKLVSHPHIPFSSDYGRRLLARERHCLPEDVALRKIERTEWYLKPPGAQPKNFQLPDDISGDKLNKHTKHVHTYKFPKKQFTQKRESLKGAFTKFLLKPVCVVLETNDVSSFVTRNNRREEAIGEETKFDVVSDGGVLCNGDTNELIYECETTSSDSNYCCEGQDVAKQIVRRSIRLNQN